MVPELCLAHRCGSIALADADSAHEGAALSSIAADREVSFALRKMTGATALRLHISGHATPPTGVNDLTVGAFDGPTLPALQLLVTYEVSAKH